MKELLKSILTKKAKGYTAREKTEEYSIVDGVMTLTKKKVTTKHIAADINAVKALLELSDTTDADLNALSDEQLEVEKLRLINMLAICNKYGTNNEKEKNND